MNSRGHVKPIAGPVALSRNSGNFHKFAEPWKHKHDTEKEMWLMTRVMARISDPDKVKKSINDAIKETNRYKHLYEKQCEEIISLKRASFKRRN